MCTERLLRCSQVQLLTACYRYRSGVAHDLRIACLNNAAMCQVTSNILAVFDRVLQVKIEAWDAVITTCSETIEIDSKTVKAWYRRGLANQKLRDWDHAKSDLRTALEIEPKNKACTSICTVANLASLMTQDVAKQLESCQKEQMATKKQKVATACSIILNHPFFLRQCVSEWRVFC